MTSFWPFMTTSNTIILDDDDFSGGLFSMKLWNRKSFNGPFFSVTGKGIELQIILNWLHLIFISKIFCLGFDPKVFSWRQILITWLWKVKNAFRLNSDLNILFKSFKENFQKCRIFSRKVPFDSILEYAICSKFTLILEVCQEKSLWTRVNSGRNNKMVMS